MSTIIENVRIVKWGQDGEIAADQAILIEDGKIAGIDSASNVVEKNPKAERLDGGGQLLMPGNICAHTHFYGAYARGLGIPGEAPKDFNR